MALLLDPAAHGGAGGAAERVRAHRARHLPDGRGAAGRRGAARRACAARPQEVWTGGETLSPAMRARIEQAFGAALRNSYGASEFLPIAWECAQGRLHVNADWVILEAVDAHHRPVPAGQLVAHHAADQPGQPPAAADPLRHRRPHRAGGRALPLRLALPVIQVQGRSDDMLVVRGPRRRAGDAAAAGAEHRARGRGRRLRLPAAADRPAPPAPAAGAGRAAHGGGHGALPPGAGGLTRRQRSGGSWKSRCRSRKACRWVAAASSSASWPRPRRGTGSGLEADQPAQQVGLLGRRCTRARRRPCSSCGSSVRRRCGR